MGDWLQVVRSRRPRVLLRKQRLLVLDAIKDHLTLDIISAVHAVNTDLVVIPGGILANKLFKIISNKCLLNGSWQRTMI
jgi:hypothetical protein